MKDKIRKEVRVLCNKKLGSEHTMAMTDEMHTIYCWALNNASIKQLKKWKKEFESYPQ
jgi:hypothetical protein